jgi:hypothetical protein
MAENYYKLNRKERLTYQKKYYEEKKEEILVRQRAYFKEYYRRNKEKINEKNREYSLQYYEDNRKALLHYYHHNKHIKKKPSVEIKRDILVKFSF